MDLDPSDFKSVLITLKFKNRLLLDIVPILYKGYFKPDFTGLSITLAHQVVFIACSLYSVFASARFDYKNNNQKMQYLGDFLHNCWRWSVVAIRRYVEHLRVQ